MVGVQTDRGEEAEIRAARLDIYKVIALRVSWSVILLQAVLAPYFMSKGLAIPDIFLVQTIFALSLVVGELPTGILSDLVGRRAVLILATVFRGLGGTGLVLADGFWGMAISYVLIALANNALSGSDIAALVERHRLLTGARTPLPMYLGRQKSLEFVAATLSALAGGYIASRSMEMAGLLNMVFAWMAFPIALSMGRDASPFSDQRALSPSLVAKVQLPVRALAASLHEQPAVAMSILAVASFTFLSAICAYAYQTAWLSFGYNPALMGLLFATRSFSAAAAAWAANRVAAVVGSRSALVLASLAAVAAFALATWNSVPVAVCSLLLIGVTDGAANVLLIADLNGRIGDTYRATLNSLYNFISRILVVAIAPLLALLSSRMGVLYPFYFLVGISILAGLNIPFLYLRGRPSGPA